MSTEEKTSPQEGVIGCCLRILSAGVTKEQIVSSMPDAKDEKAAECVQRIAAFMSFARGVQNDIVAQAVYEAEILPLVRENKELRRLRDSMADKCCNIGDKK